MCKVFLSEANHYPPLKVGLLQVQLYLVRRRYCTIRVKPVADTVEPLVALTTTL